MKKGIARLTLVWCNTSVELILTEGKTMVTVEYNGKDQNGQDETTIYWFTLNGKDYKTGITFDDSKYALADNNGNLAILDCDGCPMDECNWEIVAVYRAMHDSIMDIIRQG